MIKTPDIKALQAEREAIYKKENAFFDKVEKHKASYGSLYYKPYKWQARFIEKVREKLITLTSSPNKIGKTAMGSNIVISWALGYEPWNRVSKEEAKEDLHVEIKGVYYRKSSLGIDPPVMIRISGEDWEEHIEKTLIPTLKEFAPAEEYKLLKNNQGAEAHWVWKNESEFILQTHRQDVALWESSNNDGWWPDEPPPKDKYDSMTRGLFLRKGKIIMPTTPLKEAWILDDLVLSNRKEIGIIEDLSILDNDDLKEHDMEVLRRIWLESRNN